VRGDHFVDERAHARGQDRIGRGERAVALDGEVTRDQGRAAREHLEHVGIDAARAEQRGLHRDGAHLLT
jgi:hypothetical protein